MRRKKILLVSGLFGFLFGFSIFSIFFFYFKAEIYNSFVTEEKKEKM